MITDSDRYYRHKPSNWSLKKATEIKAAQCYL